MRTINRKWLSSKLHPIIIKAKKTKKKRETNNPQITARHKVTANTGEPSHTSHKRTRSGKSNMEMRAGQKTDKSKYFGQHRTCAEEE